MKKLITSIIFLLLIKNSLICSVPQKILVNPVDSMLCDENIKVSTILTSKKTYKTNNNDIEIVFDGVFVEYAFIQIGYIEVSGNDSTELKELLECIKSNAANNGADAVINIKRQMVKSKISESIPAFNGVMIKYITDDEIEENSSLDKPDSLIIKNEPSGFAKLLSIVTLAIIFSTLLIY